MIYYVYVTWCIEIHQTYSPLYYVYHDKTHVVVFGMMSSWDGGSLRDCSRSAQAQGDGVSFLLGNFLVVSVGFFRASMGFLFWVIPMGFFRKFYGLIYGLRRNRSMSFYEFLWHSLVFDGLWWRCTWEWDTSSKPRRIGWCKEAIALVIDVEWRKRMKKGYPIFRQTHMLRAFAHRKLWFNQS